MTTDIAGKTKRIIREQLHVPEARVTPQASFVRDLGADSLHFIELTVVLEEQFEVEISDEDAERIRTVQDAIDFIEWRTRNRTGRPDPRSWKTRLIP
jgi:acyl carrier protein